jgi:K(+)-stimulated pyrophosphate-energized sodium pump
MGLSNVWRRPLAVAAALVAVSFAATPAFASETDLILPDLSAVKFHGISGRALLMAGLIICVAGLAFGLVIYRYLKQLPVHRSMLEVSELIYATCKTYLRTQGKFILILWAFIAVIMIAYFGFLQTPATEAPAGPGVGAVTDLPAVQQFSTAARVIIILLFSLVGNCGLLLRRRIRHSHQHLR